MHYIYIRIVRLIIFCLLFIFGYFGLRGKRLICPTSRWCPIHSSVYFSSFMNFYSRIIDEYKADLYIKGKVKVHKRNHLIRYVPSMFRFEKHINDYLMESLSELHYTAPDIYDRKIKAVSLHFHVTGDR